LIDVFQKELHRRRRFPLRLSPLFRPLLQARARGEAEAVFRFVDGAH
jgi:hypothetical protein